MLETEISGKLKEFCHNKGWMFHPELNNWDSVISNNRLIAGIQFKIKLSVKAISQCLLKNGVHYRILVFNIAPKNLNDYWVICHYLKIILIQYIDGELVNLMDNKSVYWLLRYKIKTNKPMILPEFELDIPAGDQAPLRQSTNNIFLVDLELKNYQNNNRGILSSDEAMSIIKRLGTIPKKYFYWDKNINHWRFRENRLPSREFEHIAKGFET